MLYEGFRNTKKINAGKIGKKYYEGVGGSNNGGNNNSWGNDGESNNSWDNGNQGSGDQSSWEVFGIDMLHPAGDHWAY